MAIWDRLKRKSQDTSQAIEIKKDIHRLGLSVQLINGDQPIELPLVLSIAQYKVQTNIELLELIDSLWYEEVIFIDNEGYYIPYELFNKLSANERTLLDIPEETECQLFLTNQGAVGQSNFKFELVKDANGWKNIDRSAKSIGPWRKIVDGSVLLLAEHQYEFEKLLNQPIDVKDKDQIFKFVAKVLSEAKKLQIDTNDYLNKQNYLFVDGLDLGVEASPNEIKVNSQYTSTDQVDHSLLQDMSTRQAVYAKNHHGAKIFVDDTVISENNKIKQMKPIIGQDVPKFIENPEAFLPESELFDLSQFSERVKSLGIRVYKAQPYVHASEKERGWFDIETGITLTGSTVEDEQSLDVESFNQFLEDTKQQNEEYVYYEDKWVKVPSQLQDFVAATDTFKQMSTQETTSQIDITKLPYVLEIFENINQLDFNKPIIDLFEQWNQSEVLDQSLPQSFKAQLKPFQMDGYMWLKKIYHRKIGGLLADDMGLGKTIQIISLLAYLNDRNELNKTLIVVPKTLIENWVQEIQKFAPSLSYKVYVHSGHDRYRTLEELQPYSIVITTYHTLAKDQLLLGQLEWQFVACDEAQAIKNPTTAITKVLKAMNTKSRIAMTGTPIENGLSELWSIMDFVQPGLLGSLSQFKETYINSAKDADNLEHIEQMLMSQIAPIYKRRLKSGELKGQLPDKKIHVVEANLSKLQEGLYEDIIAQVQNKQLAVLSAIQQLKQLCAHPGLVYPQYRNVDIKEVPKLAKTLDILEKIRVKNEKVLIFTELKEMQQILRNIIRDRFGINASIINGMTNRRQQVVQEFNGKPGFDILILSPKAAGTGLTITSANHVIHYTRWWNPAVENQATDRVYRIGQEKDVSVYYPIVVGESSRFTSGTVEEIVHRILLEKQSLATSIIVPSQQVEIEKNIMNNVFSQPA